MDNTSNENILNIFQSTRDGNESDKTKVIQDIDVRIKKGAYVITEDEADCVYVTQQIIGMAVKNICILINKNDLSEMRVYEDERILKALSKTLNKGVSLSVIFSQFEKYDDIFSTYFFKILKKRRRESCKIECLSLEPDTPDIFENHPSFIFADRIGLRIKSETESSASDFNTQNKKESWIDFPIMYFEMIKPLGKRISLI